MQPALSVTPTNCYSTAGLAASALCLESSVTFVPGLDSQLHTIADSTTDVAFNSPGRKPSDTLGTPEGPALCCESCGSLHTHRFFPQPCLGFAQGKEVSGTCWGTARLVPFHRGCPALGVAAASRAHCSNVQPRRFRLKQRTPEAKHAPLYPPHP